MGLVKKQYSGTTLLEMMLVFTIIAVISAASIRYVMNSYQNQYIMSILADLNLIASAASAYAVGSNQGYLGFTYVGPPGSNTNGFSITASTTTSYTVSYPSISGSSCASLQHIISSASSKYSIASCPTTTIVYKES